MTNLDTVYKRKGRSGLYHIVENDFATTKWKVIALNKVTSTCDKFISQCGMIISSAFYILIALTDTFNIKPIIFCSKAYYHTNANRPVITFIMVFI